MKRLSLKTVSLALIGLALSWGGWDGISALAGGKQPAAESQAGGQAAGSSVPPAQAQQTGSASVSGTVTLEGSAPKTDEIKMDADPICAQQHGKPVYSQEVVVNDGRLQHVFVYVKEGIKGDYPVPAEPVVLDQVGCMYEPHIFGIQVGQKLEIRNSDPTLHNVNCKPQANRRFNIAQPIQGMKTVKSFDKPEVMVPFRCNVHPWMAAFGGVVAHPFHGVTDENGAFTLEGLPAGTYTIEAWHEKFGAQSRTVTVAEGESKALDFTFQAK